MNLLIHKGNFIILLMATTQQNNIKNTKNTKNKRTPEEIASYKLALTSAQKINY